MADAAAGDGDDEAVNQSAWNKLINKKKWIGRTVRCLGTWGRRFNRFCEFSSIGGLRFFASSVTNTVRIPAAAVLCIACTLLFFEVRYIVGNYQEGRNQAVTNFTRTQHTRLFVTYVCESIYGVKTWSFFDQCFNTSGFDDVFTIYAFSDQFRACGFVIGGYQFECQFSCHWTVFGYCISILPNMQAFGEVFSPLTIENAYMRFRYLPINPIDQTRVFFVPFTSEKPPVIKAIIAPTAIVRKNWLYYISLAHRFEVAGLKVANDLDYSNCIWQSYFDDNQTCDLSVLPPLNPPTKPEIDIKFGTNTVCAEKLARVAQLCETSQQMSTLFITTSSVMPNYTEADPLEISPMRLAGNVIAVTRGSFVRITSFEDVNEVWKVISDVGGSLALCIGFTVLSVVEAIAFFASTRLQNIVSRDELAMLQAKNPPIHWPLPLPPWVTAAITNFWQSIVERVKNRIHPAPVSPRPPTAPVAAETEERTT